MGRDGVREILDNYEGDAEHMAATANGAWIWGLAAGKPVVELGDLGGWSMDLVTLGKNYRKASSTDIEDFVNHHLGAPGSTAEFPQADLIADADGWLLARSLRESKSVAESLRSMLLNSPGWRTRLGLFLDGRFGSPAVLSGAVGALFGPTWAWPQFPRDMFIDKQTLPDGKELPQFRSAVSTRLYKLAGGS